MLFHGCLLALVSLCSAQRSPLRPVEPPGERPPPLPLPQKTTTPPPETKNATYWISFGNRVRPGQDMVFTVNILKGSAPVQVSVALLNTHGNKTLLSKVQSVLPGAPSQIILNLPFDLEEPSEFNKYSRTYKVRVTGRGDEVKFKEEGNAYLKEKSLTVFVQTDKALYKPGQRVKFRVMALTPDLKPVHEPMDIVIKDPKRNRIWQRSNLTDPNGSGVLDLSLQLANRVPLGQWKITVYVLGQEEQKMFDVDEYRLPKFKVEIDTIPFGLTTHTIVPITVKATYTFGEPLTDGIVRIQLSRMYYGNSNFSILRRGELNSKGEFSVKITNKEILEAAKNSSKYISSLSYFQMGIDATVVNPDTRRTQKAEQVKVTYYSTPFVLEFLTISPSYFKTGLGYTGYLEVKKRDSSLLSPSEAAKVSVRVNITYDVPIPEEPTTTTTTTTTPATSAFPVPIEIAGRRYPSRPIQLTRTESLNETTYTLPETGWITLNFRIPEDAQSVRIRAEIVGFERWNARTKYLTKAHSPTQNFLQLLAATDKIKVGDVMTIEARATEPMSSVYLQMFSKSAMVHSATIDLDVPATEASYNVTITQDMSPSLKIVAFYMREGNSEFVVDALSLSVNGLFAKPVSVKFSRDRVKPGEAVDVVVKAPQQSRVYLLSNDKSVLLLKKGNDITHELVQEELMTYDFGYWQPWMRYMIICGWPSYFGGSDATSVLSGAEVSVLTDGLVYSHRYQSGGWRGPVAYRGGDIALMDSAGPVAMASPMGGAPESKQNVGRVRKLFPENWLWTSEVVNGKNELTIPTTAPDTITSWVTTVFSMHPEYGLSVGEEPAELITFKDMFLTLDLPLSITKDEEYCFTASLFSYYPEPISALITLEKSPHYNATYLRRDGRTVIKEKASGHYSYLKSMIRENDVETVMYCFTPVTVGKIPVRVTAVTNVNGLTDGVERILNVKADGTPRSSTYSYLVDVSAGEWTQELDVSFLNTTVPGSQYITFSTAGNLMGPLLENLDDLLRKPYGCGEQNMLNFAPNIFLLEFYFKTGTIDQKKLKIGRAYMEIGYSKEVLYEHGKTGGYSTFGNSDDNTKNASLWLTAFVTKSFAQAEQLNKYEEVLHIDTDLIMRSVNWMKTQQNRDGSFTEHGKVFNKRMQGGSATGEALTAYTVIAFHEALQVFKGSTKPHEQSLVRKIEGVLTKATDFLGTRIKYLSDAYDLCIVAYTMHLVDNPLKDAAYLAMENNATRGDGLLYWKRPEPTEKPRHYWWSNPNDAISVEATAYALLTYALRGEETTKGLPVIRWLSNQRGPNGGFYSTQDTVIGLQALTAVSASMYSSENIPVSVSVTYTTAEGQTVTEAKTVAKNTELLLQKVYVPYEDNYPKTLTLRGQTLTRVPLQTAIMAEVVLEYNVETTTNAPSYRVNHRMGPTPYGYVLDVVIRSSTLTEASMTILEVDIPAGFDLDLDELSGNRRISDIEIKDDVLVIYFDTDAVSLRGVKVSIKFYHTKGVLLSSKPKTLKVYNYYEPNDEVTVMYNLKDSDNVCVSAPKFSVCPYV